MSFLPENLNDIAEPKPAPVGTYELQITAAEERVTGENSKHPGAPMIRVTLGFTDTELNAPNIGHFITLPYEGDDNTAFKLLMLKRFLSHFKTPYTSNLEELCLSLVGQSALTEVGLGTPNETGDVFNNIRIPKWRDEVTGGSGKPPARRR